MVRREMQDLGTHDPDRIMAAIWDRWGIAIERVHVVSVIAEVLSREAVGHFRAAIEDVEVA